MQLYDVLPPAPLRQGVLSECPDQRSPLVLCLVCQYQNAWERTVYAHIYNIYIKTPIYLWNAHKVRLKFDITKAM